MTMHTDLPDTPTLDAIMRWWSALHDTDRGKGDRAGRAELRRCSSLLDALMTPAAHRLLRAARGVSRTGDDDGLLLVAIVLASIKTGGNPRISFARALGQTADGHAPGEGDGRRMSPLRFQSLLVAMRSGDPGLRIRALRRAVALAGDGGFGVRRLVGDILHFDDAVQRRWTFDYWQAFEPAEAVPETAPTEPANS
jgi:CRISPR type I-E-associated protein CasB/Cse2